MYFGVTKTFDNKKNPTKIDLVNERIVIFWLPNEYVFINFKLLADFWHRAVSEGLSSI